MLKGMTKHEDKEHGKTLKHEDLRVCRPYLTQFSLLSAGWMDGFDFMSFSTIFQSYQNNGRVNMKGSVQ